MGNNYQRGSDGQRFKLCYLCSLPINCFSGYSDMFSLYYMFLITVTVRMANVMRRDGHYVGRRAMVMKVQGRGKRGRPKRRWLDKVKDDIKEKGLSAEDVYDCVTWRRMSLSIDPT